MSIPDIDRNSQTWREIKEWANERLAYELQMLESEKQPLRLVRAQRAKAALLREILDFDRKVTP